MLPKMIPKLFQRGAMQRMLQMLAADGRLIDGERYQLWSCGRLAMVRGIMQKVIQGYRWLPLVPGIIILIRGSRPRTLVLIQHICHLFITVIIAELIFVNVKT
jgi:hypothetical protein